ncbi:hypothetical protein FOL47_007211 [Perkinsus chesapeaki]|uniref:Membrane transport protein MMPL domain-containing protein n=1 Tax=Perkinsus chesapeaki TaxID=330153 RepID=A0A7J6LMI4_PERCH|nr:hypothetical protein FOL47_007211 [Perkinsus chesapeaki]
MITSCTSFIGKHAQLVSKYQRCLHNLRYVLLPLWLILAGLGVVGVIHMFDNLTSALVAPAGSPAYVASLETTRLFPGGNFHSPEVLFVSLEDQQPGDLLGNNLLQDITETVRGSFPENISVQVADYFTAIGSGEPTSTYLSPDNKSAIFTVMFGMDVKNIGDIEKKTADLVGQKYSNISLFVGWAGILALGEESSKVSEIELGIIHAVVLPLAFLLLAYALRSWRLLLLPLTALLFSIAICGSCLYLLSLLMSVSTGGPMMMLFLLMALCIDYSLIQLTRFRQEVTGPNQRSPSGSILFVCFVCLMIIPVDLFRSIGLALMLSTLCAVGVNLTLVPTLIITFPTFFGYFGKGCCCGGDRQRNASDVPSRDLNMSGATSTTARSCLQRWLRWRFWYSWGKGVTTPWAAVVSILLLCIIAGVFGWACSFITITSNVSTASPRSSSVSETSARMSQRFTPGMSGPFTVVFENPMEGTILSEQFWTSSLDLCREIDQRLMQQYPQGSVLSPMYVKVPGKDPVEVNYQSAKFLTSPSCTSILCKQFQGGLRKSSSPLGDAVMATLITDDVPTSLKASEFVTELRRLVSDTEKQSGGQIRVWITGISVASHDSMSSVVASLPAFIAATATVCLVLVGVVYRSFVIAVRGVLTIAITLIFSFGLAAGVYLRGWLNFLNWPAVASDSSTDGLSWISAPLAFSIVLGLSLDYDIFFLGRVVEEHDRGVSDKAAVHIGVWKAGMVIALAGGIMMITFCGLIFSSTPMVNQSGFILVTAILLDAFVMQGLVTPSLLTLFGRANWWPRGYPQVVYNNPEDIPAYRAQILGADAADVATEIKADKGAAMSVQSP